jgi:hypothetical protein
MTERNELVRDAFPDDALGPSVRDRLWSSLQHRQTRQARLRNLARAGALLVVGAILAAVIFLGLGVRSPDGPVVVAADSLTNNSPSEPSMIQENREQVTTDLIPLLGHRSSLRSDIVNAEERRDELVTRLAQTSGREHDRIEQELAAVEQQLEASRMAINVIDRQLMGHEGAATYAVTTSATPQVFQFGSPEIPEELFWLAGGGGGLLLLGMLSLLVYMRRIARSTRQALSLIEGQVSSQHATLASGIDAIALEVERLGEGQRFMSKILATPETKVSAQG